MKRLWFALSALVIFFFSNLGVTPNLDMHFQPPTPSDVCDCGNICKMHVTCDIPKCNGRMAQDSEDQEGNETLSDDATESL